MIKFVPVPCPDCGVTDGQLHNGDCIRIRRVDKETAGIGKGTPGPGRKAGIPNRTTTLLKDAILAAAAKAGGEGGLEAYLAKQADENPGPFMALLGKVLPMQLTGADGEKLIIEIRKPGD